MPLSGASVEPTVAPSNQHTAQSQAHTSDATNCMSFISLNFDSIRDSAYADSSDQQRVYPRLPISSYNFQKTGLGGLRKKDDAITIRKKCAMI